MDNFDQSRLENALNIYRNERNELSKKAPLRVTALAYEEVLRLRDVETTLRGSIVMWRTRADSLGGALHLACQPKTLREHLAIWWRQRRGV